MTTYLSAHGSRAKLITAIAALLLATLLTTDPAAARTPSNASALLATGTGMGVTPSVRVRTLQRALERRGYDLGPAGVDGRFGPMTAAAVRAFQARAGLAVDGIVGRTTRRALRLRVTASGRVERRTPNRAAAPKTRVRSTGSAGARQGQRRSVKSSTATTTGLRPRQAQRPKRGAPSAPAQTAPATPDTTPSRNPWLLPIVLGAAAALLLAIASSLAMTLARSLRERIYHRQWPAMDGAPHYDRAATVPPTKDLGPRVRLHAVADPDAIPHVMASAAETGDEPPPAGNRVIGYVPATAHREPADAADPAAAIQRICRAGRWDLVDVVHDRHANGHRSPPTLISILERIAAGQVSALVVRHADDVRRPNGDTAAVSEWLESHGTRLIVHELERSAGPDVKRPPGAAITLERQPAMRRAEAGAS